MNPSTTYPANSIAPTPAVPTAASPSTGKESSGTRNEQREATADAIRDKLSGTLKQLGQRWRNMFNLKRQLNRHPVAAALSGTAVLLAIGGGVIGALENQRRKSFAYRFKKGLRQAKDRILS